MSYRYLNSKTNVPLLSLSFAVTHYTSNTDYNDDIKNDKRVHFYLIRHREVIYMYMAHRYLRKNNFTSIVINHNILKHN
jgi:hypothetical protein